MIPLAADTAAMESRVWPQIVEDDGCWVWTGTMVGQKRNRPHIRYRGVKVLVYRATYEQLRGEIPDGLTIDHLCANPACCNPWHLEPVPHAVNMRRRYGLSDKKAA